MKHVLTYITLLAIIISCSQKEEQFTVTGELENGANNTLFLQHLGANGLEVVDSVKIKTNGKFTFSQPAVSSPEFFFLKPKSGLTLPFAIDSNEVLVINSDYTNLPYKATFEGTTDASAINDLNISMIALRKEFNQYRADFEKGNAKEKEKLSSHFSDRIKTFKDSIGTRVMSNPKSAFAYYTLFQKLNSEYMLFNPYNEDDFIYYAAVATSYNTFFPESERSKALYKKVLDAIKLKRQQELADYIESAEGTIPEINLPDAKGDTITLSSLKGKVVILHFWGTKGESTVAWNSIINKNYNKYKSKGLRVYAVGLDNSKILWEDAIKTQKLDWINVNDFKAENNRDRINYNVTSIPTSFLIDRNGDVTARITSEAQLEAEIKKAL